MLYVAKTDFYFFPCVYHVALLCGYITTITKIRVMCYLLGLWLRLECSLDCIIYVSEGFDVPRDYRSRRGRETIKRYDVTETYSHVVRQNLSETSITCAESG